MSNLLYMVVYDDNDCLRFPYAIDPDCDGALTTHSSGELIALFSNRKAALRAIAISTAFARLQTSQGKPANTDFTESRQFVKIEKAQLVQEDHP